MVISLIQHSSDITRSLYDVTLYTLNEAAGREERGASWNLDVGGIRLKLMSSVSASAFRLSPAYNDFLIPPSDRADVVVRVHHGLPPVSSLGQPLWAFGPVSFYQAEGRPWWIVSDDGRGSTPRCVVALDPLLSTGDIWLSGDEGELDPLPHPLGAIVTNHWLVHRRAGVMVHAAGVSYHGHGMLFAGYSGAGKTTLSRLWLEQAGSTVLNDDRVIVRQRSGGYWAYGTPWHSQERTVSNLAVPLERIFVVRHGPHNQAKRLSPAAATAALLARTFLPYWDAEGTAFVLEFVQGIVDQVPCFSLAFVPDTSVVDYLLEMLGA